MKRTNKKMIQYIFEMILISKSINQNFKKCIWFKLQLIRYIDYWPLKKQNAFFNLFQLSLKYEKCFATFQTAILLSKLLHDAI